MTKPLLFSKACSAVALTLALAACGGGGGSGSGDAVQGASAGGPPRDNFFALVLAMVATSLDNAEPQEIDAITATFPQGDEPSTVGG
ncbi:MAG: hypothetical protein H7273_13055 [Polaromonas sp.]|nr:hypothetical protein [Polaromonas sp.]